ncbi:MAG: ACT domain-containing protein [Clostridia bacterium]|nr:ACT domain-containing protein [Clostridia bacterium]
MKAVITVLGKDTVGILAKVSAFCAERNMNIVEVTQSVLQDMFAMVMLVEFDRGDVPSFEKLNADFDAFGNSIGTKIHIMHEDIFNSMHKI